MVAQELRRDPAAVCRSSPSTRSCWPPCGVRSRPSAPRSSGTGRRPRSRRSCGSSARPTRTSAGPSRSSSRATTSASGSPPCCTRWSRPSQISIRCISPFLPHAANRVHAVLGGQGELMPMPRLEVVRDLDDDARSYPVITGEYSATPSGSRGPSSSGRRSPSRPVFRQARPRAGHRGRAGPPRRRRPGGTRHTDPLARRRWHPRRPSADEAPTA